MAAAAEKDQIMSTQHHENASMGESGSEERTQTEVPTVVDGAEVDGIPRGYFRSPLFLGTYFVSNIQL